jgi:hypothetical protein
VIRATKKKRLDEFIKPLFASALLRFSCGNHAVQHDLE